MPKKNLKLPNNSPLSYKLKYKICVSGAAETGHCAPDSFTKAEAVGREIARAGHILVTGATTGIPYWSAKGAKAEGGIVVGLSPAASKISHIKTYHLPTDYHDFIIYTGFEYSGRNLLLTRSADAVIVICGRMGTLNEFTIAFEELKPIGVLEGSGGTADLARELVEKARRGPGRIFFSKDPKTLVEKLIEAVRSDEERSGIKGRIL